MDHEKWRRVLRGSKAPLERSVSALFVSSRVSTLDCGRWFGGVVTALVVLVGMFPLSAQAQGNRFEEAIRQQDRRAVATGHGRLGWATGDSKARRRARRMLERVRGTGRGTEGYQPMAPGTLGSRMAEIEKRGRYLFWVLLGIPGGLLLVFILKLLYNVFVRPVVRPIRRYRGAGARALPSMSQVRKLASMARRYERQERVLDAAQLYEAAYEMKSTLFGAPNGVPGKARERPFLEKAAQLYEKAREYKKAAEIQVKLGVPGKMRELFLLQGKEYESQRKFLLAADMYAKAHDFVAAAAMNEAGGHIHGAAAYYERVGEKLKAAKLYEKFYKQEKLDHFGSEYDQKAYNYVRKYALKSARLYATCGKLRTSARIFAEFSEFVAAGKMLLKAGRFIEAVNVLMRSDDLDLLREALDKADAERIDPELLARAMEKLGEPDAAASMLLSAGRSVEAAAIYEKTGNLNKAAEIYERHGSLDVAAELWARAKEFKRAAKDYLKLDDKKAAIEMYRRLGDVRKMAELKAELGDFLGAASDLFGQGADVEAMSMLQRVKPDHPDFLDAFRLLGERLIKNGQFQKARRILEATLSSITPRSREAKEIYYLLALASIGDNMFERAKECLEQVLDIDYAFKDASELYDSLLAGGLGGGSE